MGKDRKTQALFRRIDAFLKWTGLYKAAKGTPSLLVTILASVVMMECVVVAAPIEYGVLAQPGILILGVALGVISVKAGEFWDRKVFDPRYGLRGTWLTNRPWAIFPPGSDLKHYRDRAIEKLKPSGSIDPKTGKHVYRASKSIVQKNPKRWDRVNEPNTLSKFARNFILPLLAAAVLFLAMFLWKLVAGNSGFAMLLIVGAAAVCLILALLLFIPYFSFKIEHMINLYSEVVEILDGKAST